MCVTAVRNSAALACLVVVWSLNVKVGATRTTPWRLPPKTGFSNGSALNCQWRCADAVLTVAISPWEHQALGCWPGLVLDVLRWFRAGSSSAITQGWRRACLAQSSPAQHIYRSVQCASKCSRVAPSASGKCSLTCTAAAAAGPVPARAPKQLALRAVLISSLPHCCAMSFSFTATPRVYGSAVNSNTSNGTPPVTSLPIPSPGPEHRSKHREAHK